MWQRIRQSILSKLTAKPLAASHPSVTPSYSSNETHAHQQLKSAIRDLSDGQSIPRMTRAPVGQLKSWAVMDIGKLDLPAMEELARTYYEGSTEISRDVGKALELWEAASKLGSIESKYSRAMCLWKGVDGAVQTNLEEAFKSMSSLAEEHNYNLAHYAVAAMLFDGEGTPQDREQAFKHFKLAARGGVTPALRIIGNCYANGWGVRPSEHNALLYFEAGAEAGDPLAQFTLGTWYATGRGMQRIDKRKAFDLQLLAAKAGHPGAMFNVGTMYLTGGRGSSSSPGRGRNAGSAAPLSGAESDNSQAQLPPGFRLINADPNDPSTAGDLFSNNNSQSIEAGLSGGNSTSDVAAGGAVEHGKQDGAADKEEEEAYPKQDFDQAREWYERAAAKNVVEASINLGNMYKYGYGVEPDLEKAAQIFARFSDKHELSRELLQQVRTQQQQQQQ